MAESGVYYIYSTEDRRTKRKSLGTRDWIEANERYARRILVEVALARGQEPQRTIAEFWAIYLKEHVGEASAKDVMPKGRETIFYAWKNLSQRFGALTIDQLDQAAIDAYVAARLKGRIGRKSKPVTVRRELISLYAALNFCAKWHPKSLPKESIQPVRLPEAGGPRQRTLSLDEVQRLLDAAAEYRQGTRLSRGEKFLWLALETAARQQAILDLTWDRVHLDVGMIDFNVPGRRVTKKKRASVPISSSLRPVIERAYMERGQETHVLENQGAIWPIIQRVAIRAGFSEQKVKGGTKPKGTGVSAHVLRHTAATLMARRGVTMWAIANILGNSVSMVERVYAKWAPDDPANTVDKISGGLLRPPK